MHVGQTHLVPAVKSLASRGLQLGSQALERATLNAAEIINTLDVLEQEGYFQSNALENGNLDALGNGGVGDAPNRPYRKSRHDTPPRRGNARGYEPVIQERKPLPLGAHSFNSQQEWLEYSHNRGVLVEELRKRPNWHKFTQDLGSTPELRKKLNSMSSADLADLLLRMDRL